MYGIGFTAPTSIGELRSRDRHGRRMLVQGKKPGAATILAEHCR
jgi:hypothetical protein